ncbi:MAG: lipase family protein [Candidatus Omnitrophica bacterium]|nr:lipase family protein [Candidatus Omnitrophota bacterium]
MNITKQLALATLHQCMRIGGDQTGEEKPVIIKSKHTDAETTIVIDDDLKIIFCIHSGSDHPKDFILDAKFHKDVIGFFDDKPVKVHCGFSESEYSIHETTVSMLMDAVCRYPSHQIVVGGHSLGGSSAELFGYRMPFELCHNCMIITFGKADTGNENFADALEWRIPHNFRFFNENDLVPKLLAGKFNYAKSGIPIMLKNISDDRKAAKNIAAAVVNHDTHLDYWLPIQALPCELNEGIKV